MIEWAVKIIRAYIYSLEKTFINPLLFFPEYRNITDRLWIMSKKLETQKLMFFFGVQATDWDIKKRN